MYNNNIFTESEIQVTITHHVVFMDTSRRESYLICGTLYLNNLQVVYLPTVCELTMTGII